MSLNYKQTVLKDAMNMTFTEFQQIREVYNGIHKHVSFFCGLQFRLYSKLYEFLKCEEEMPIGTQKARDGDPEEWIFDKLENEWNKELAIV